MDSASWVWVFGVFLGTQKKKQKMRPITKTPVELKAVHRYGTTSPKINVSAVFLPLSRRHSHRHACHSINVIV